MIDDVGYNIDRLLTKYYVRDILEAIFTSEELNDRERRQMQRALDVFDGRRGE